MNLGFMQPYFVPYLGYFDLIQQTDEWVFFDSAQFIRRGWVNRNRILKQGGGWSYITVPVQHAPLSTSIRDIAIDDDQTWRQRILAQFDVLRPHAPFFTPVRDLLADALRAPTPSLAELNIGLIERVCAYLSIARRMHRFSALPPSGVEVAAAGDWALHLCSALGATGYLNPPGGTALYDPTVFAAHGITLRIQNFAPMPYPTPGFEAVENLSILDVLAWNPPAAVRAHLAAQPRYFS